MADVLAEVSALVDDGVREVTLLGQTVNAWGRREGRSLGELLYALESLSGLERVRFITSHPEEMDDMLADAMADCRKSGLFLHLPPQSGSTTVLRRMARGYTSERYLEIIAQLRERIPGIQIGADIIVGFCGETEADFEATLRMMETVRFSQAYIFRYSPRPGTPAHGRLPDDVPDTVKRERLAELLKLQSAIMSQRHAAMEGSVHQVLVEGASRRQPALHFGRNLAFDRLVFEADGDAVDAFVDVRVTSSTALTLTGHLVASAAVES
jgi:tRNA-2-methylthio-N6-dimethylallyladenosine synthase